MDKEFLIAEAQLRIQRCEAALRQRTVSPEVVEVSIAMMRLVLVELQRPNYPVIPEGWQLVPIEPTDEMFDAAYRFPASTENRMRKQYQAMLAAAPAPGAADA